MRILLFLLAFHIVNGLISSEVNPRCPPDTDCTKPWLIHVINQPSSNASYPEYHHLWGSVGAPTFISAQTALNTSLHVDWAMLGAFNPASVNFSTEPLNVFGFSIIELILFNDTDETGSIATVPEDQQFHLPSYLFNWQYSNTTANVKDVNSFSTIFSATQYNGTDLGGEVRIIIENFAVDTRMEVFPKLQVKPSAANIDFVLDNLVPKLSNDIQLSEKEDVIPLSGFASPRWALKVSLYSSENSANEFYHTQTKSQNDEYAPGVFKLDEITTPRARNSSSKAEGGYMQWRPVAYLTSDRDVSKSTLPSLSPPCNGTRLLPHHETQDTLYIPDFILQPPVIYYSEIVPVVTIKDSQRMSLAYAVWGDTLTDTLTGLTIVSFGADGDGYYTAYNYTVWTLTTGSGSSLEESLSVGVLLALLCGVALPLSTLLIAAVAVKVYQCRRAKKDESHRPLVEDTEHEET